MELTSSYHVPLVLFSVFIAVLASYTALELTERITARGKIKLSWLIGSSLTMGTGIWSMHFVGMLAYSIPVPISYDLTTVIISWIAALIASSIAFYYLHRGFLNLASLVWAGALMGSGIGTMHYIGMAAMRVQAKVQYNFFIIALSVVFAVILSTLALGTANYVKGRLAREELKIGGSFLMGTAISGMHYIGMAAVSVFSTKDSPLSALKIQNTALAYTIGVVTVIILVGGFMACLRAQREALQQMAQKLQKSFTALERVNQELEKRVAARTAQLKKAKEATEKRNVQLKKAKEIAEAANQAKDRFLANISHELRTPLNSILGYARILQRDTNLNPSQLKNLSIVQYSGTHLLTLINDILDFSKTKAGKIELYPTNLHLPSFLDGILDLVRMWSQEKGLELKYETENDLPTGIEADEKRLRQVLINLLSNGIKFTSEGEVTLKISLMETITGATTSSLVQQKLRFEVRDTGMGMSPQELEKIFQPFEQVGDIQSRAAGTGLGLSLSQQLVELMGGELRVKSKLGAGSTFWFDVVFPVVEVILEAEEDRPGELLGYKGKRRKLLVVDDKEENRELLVKILKPIGFEVETATNGEQMLSMAFSIRPDLILLDLFMPVKTGFTSSKELHQRPELRNIPIIVVSASSITEEMRQYLECEAYISKPIDEEKLLALLQEYLHLEWIYHKAS
ncbi:MAG: MHYT domain-containing protein [Prochloraceae cyanobacterium]